MTERRRRDVEMAERRRRDSEMTETSFFPGRLGAALTE